MEEIEHEMKVIADSGIEEILMLTGESKSKSSITYIGDACRLAKNISEMWDLKFIRAIQRITLICMNVVQTM